MSLFKLRDAWAARFSNEEFETRGLALGDVLNESPIVPDNNTNIAQLSSSSQQIVIGSFSGFVRVFRPSHKGSQDDDLLLEHNLNAPVLQVAIAPAHTVTDDSSSSTSKHHPKLVNVLIALCPRKLVFLYITAVENQKKGASGQQHAEPHEGAGADAEEKMTNIASGSAYKVEVVAEVIQQRTAHSFCTGAFGKPEFNAKNPRPHGVCVQSMDGNLQFYSGRYNWFNRFLPSTTFLVPGCISYCAKTDQFFVSTSALTVECYGFQTLAGASGSETKLAQDDKNGNAKISGQKLNPDWSFTIGEDIIDIKEVKLLGKDVAEIGILAEHSFLLLSSSGLPLMNFRLDYLPMCMAVFPKPSSSSSEQPVGQQEQMILVSSTGSYFVHSGQEIIWSAKGGGSAAPISCAVAEAPFCNNTKGMIVSLSDDGFLTVNYLGTDPATDQSIQLLQREEVDVEATLRENAELQHAIAAAASGQGGKIAEEAQEKRAEADSWAPLEITYDPPELDYEQGIVSASFFIYFPGESNLQNVVLTLSASLPIAPASSTFTIASLPGRSRVSIPVNFGINPKFQSLMPSSLLIDAVATYEPPSVMSSSSNSSSSNNARTVISRTSVALPLGLVCRPVQQIKNSPFKLQIDITNRETVPQVDQLFEDVVAFNQELSSTNALSVQFANGADSTVLLSKNGTRYRVQSSTFPGLWLLTSELLRRLRKLCNNDVVTDFPDDVPLSDMFQSIDDHFDARSRLQVASTGVELLSEQFRAVERRLIARFREQNPAPMKSMQNLFEVTYRSLRDSCDLAEQCQVDLKTASSFLACSIHLTLLISKYKLQLSREDFEMLRNFLSPNVEDSSVASDLWWEETTVTGLTHLLRTSLSKNAAAGATVVAQPLQKQDDTGRVKKNISLVFERLGKGAKLAVSSGTD